MKSQTVAVKEVAHREYNYLVEWFRGGKRHRKYFTAKNKVQVREVRDYAQQKELELTNEGRRHGEWTDSEKAAVILARDMAEKYAALGVTDFTIEAALSHYAAHLDALRVSVPLLTAYDEFQEAKAREKKSARYLQDIETTLQRFAKAHKRKLVAELSEQEIEKYLHGLKVGPVTVANHHRLISVFLSWCITRGYAERNTAANYKAPTATAEEPGILSASQTAALLNAASPEITPALAIALFAGLRASEVSRLNWREVDVQHGAITVSARNAKTRRRRVVSMPANLKQWLAPYARLEGPVAPSPQVWRNRLSDARTAAGIEEWPHNAARHSCASYAYDFHQNAALVAVQLGHDVAVLETNYKGLVKPGEGKKYFDITPQSAAPANVLHFGKAAA